MTTETSAGAPDAPYKLTVSEPEMWKRIVEVEIDRDYFEGEYGKNLRLARKKHSRPGFRKGKVPMAMVESDLGGEVRMDTLEEVVPRAYQSALVEHKFVPVSDPVMDDLKMDDGEPVRISLAVEVRPEIEARDYDDLPLKRHEVQLADGAVDEALDRMRDGRSTWDHVERAAAVGDQVKVDITPLSEAGEPEEDKVAKDYSFEVGAEGNFDVFDEAMTGAVAGDERDVEVTYPDDYVNEELRGRTVSYKIVVGEVLEKNAPELDDAFASSLKEGQTLLELRANIRDELTAEEERKTEQASREEITDLLVERNPLDLPPSLVDRYLDSGVEEMKQRSAYMGRTVTDEETAAYREAGRSQAERSIKAMIILEAVRRREEIKVSDEKVIARVEEIAASNGFPPADYLEYVQKNHEDERIAHDLAEDMTFDFLRSRAKYED